MAELAPLFPTLAINVDGHWGVVDRMTGRPWGTVSNIGGDVLKAECRHHEPRCKLILPFGGVFDEPEALVCKWLISGATMTCEEHRECGRHVSRDWRKVL